MYQCFEGLSIVGAVCLVLYLGNRRKGDGPSRDVLDTQRSSYAVHKYPHSRQLGDILREDEPY